jgi:hypothetical protein
MKSPDRLDAAMYAGLDMSKLLNSPYGNSKPGDTVMVDANMMDTVYPFYSDWTW